MRLPIIVALFAFALPAAAQEPVVTDAYRDEAAGELLRLARDRRAVVDTRITRYRTTARERWSVKVGVGGFDRLFFRRETAARIDWTRDTVRIELLGAREVIPAADASVQRTRPGFVGALPSLAFDPVDGEMLLRFDTSFIRHPISPGSESFYRFSSGDSTSITLPDGKTVRLHELRVVARRPNPSLVNGSFWIDAESHAVVRAAFRPSQGFTMAAEDTGSVRPGLLTRGLRALTPEMTARIDHIAIEYGLWNLRWWLPRTLIASGFAEAAGVRVPISYERSYDGYEVEGNPDVSAPVTVELAEIRPCRRRYEQSINIGPSSSPQERDSLWNSAFREAATELAAADTSSEQGGRCRRTVLLTRDEGVDLVDSPAFAASIFDENEGALTQADLHSLEELIDAIPGPPWILTRPNLRLLSSDFIRYNRIEGLSLGGSGSVALGPTSLRGEARVGTTGEAGLRLSAMASGPRLGVEAAGYRELQAMEIASSPFSLGSSASALLLGRDENDYFRGTGVELRLAPAEARAQSWGLRLYAERQEPLHTETDFTVRGLFDDDRQVRENLAADGIDQVGASVILRRTLGEDATRFRGSAALELLGETGDLTFGRPLLRLDGERALGRGIGLALSGSAGSSFGDVPIQRNWTIGGVRTVRGHDAAALRGEALWLGRGELTLGRPLFRLSLFGDAGWAGPRSDVWESRPIKGVGTGISLLNNLVRLDVARGIGGGGTRVYFRLGGVL